jgi:hypothetical protein
MSSHCWHTRMYALELHACICMFHQNKRDVGYLECSRCTLQPSLMHSRVDKKMDFWTRTRWIYEHEIQTRPSRCSEALPHRASDVGRGVSSLDGQTPCIIEHRTSLSAGVASLDGQMPNNIELWTSPTAWHLFDGLVCNRGCMHEHPLEMHQN